MSALFGKTLKKIRESCKNPSISQSDLAKKLGLKSYKQIQRYEDGMIPPLEKLIILCDIFEYDFLSPATDGRCTIVDYFKSEENVNEGKPFQIDKGVALPSLKLVPIKEDAEKQNTQPEPGIKELMDAINDGFNSSVLVKTLEDVKRALNAIASASSQPVDNDVFDVWNREMDKESVERIDDIDSVS